MPMNWKGDEALRLIRNEAAQRLSGAAMFVRGKARENISRAQPTKLIHSSSGLSRRIGLDPSQPGEFPKKVSGYLRRGVAWEVEGNALEARVGTNVPYGKWLETGTRRMAARPWLLPTVLQSLGEITQKFGVGHKI